jgi:hypothetical protein
MKNKKSKLLVALSVGMLMLSGLAMNASATGSGQDSITASYAVFKEIRDNPLNFIKAEKISLPDSFDYIDELNKEFADGFIDGKIAYQSGDSLKEKEK